MTHAHPLAFKTIPDLSTLNRTFPSVKTFLFDMDGTLFDTEKYHTLALQQIGLKYKIAPPLGPKEVHELMMGKADHLLFDLIKDWPNFPPHWGVEDFVAEKNRQLLHLLSSVRGEAFFSMELRTLLEQARNNGIKIGLVTSSEKIITHALLKLTGLEDFFSYVLTRDDSQEVKPHPWPYLKAMDHFNSSPSETLVFEDSNVGIEAATSSGAHVIKAQWY